MKKFTDEEMQNLQLVVASKENKKINDISSNNKLDISGNAQISDLSNNKPIFLEINSFIIMAI